jgi:hypothetical protein
MRDILIRPHDDDAALTVDAAEIEDVLVGLQVGAKHLLVVSQAVSTVLR